MLKGLLYSSHIAHEQMGEEETITGGGEPNNSNGCRVEKAYFKNTAKLCTYLKCDFELQVVALKKKKINDRTSNSNPIRK